MMWTALILGFTGSLHCLGMCSPLMLAVTNASSGTIISRLLYNAGRIFTYGGMGAIISSTGLMIPVAKYQNPLSIAFGICLLIIAFSGVHPIRIPYVTKGFLWVSTGLRRKFADVLKARRTGSLILLGMLNGMLPCGITMIAFSYCFLLPGPLDGLGFMLMFGMGTLPVMLGVVSLLSVSIKKINISFPKLTSGLLALSGVLLIARVLLHAGMEHPSEIVDIVICR